MSASKQQYITDDRGKKVAVIVPIKKYEKMLEEVEELEDIRLYDEAKAANEPSVPIDEAFKHIEEERKKKVNEI